METERVICERRSDCESDEKDTEFRDACGIVGEVEILGGKILDFRKE